MWLEEARKRKLQVENNTGQLQRAKKMKRKQKKNLELPQRHRKNRN